jgi:5'-deoxynucleotidase YfbR-like HD superfamily hydrolase
MNLAKTFGMLSGLSGTYRFSNAKLVHRESVLEHLGAVTLTCFLIWEELADIAIEFSTKNGYAVLAKAVVHDVEELLMGDIPRTTKYASENSIEAFKAMERTAIFQIIKDLELRSHSLRVYHADAKSNQTGTIVKIADALAVVYKVHEEAIERGNKAMMSRASTIDSQLKNCRRNVSDLKCSHEAKTFLYDIITQAQAVVDKANLSQSNSQIEEDYAEKLSLHQSQLRHKPK